MKTKDTEIQKGQNPQSVISANVYVDISPEEKEGIKVFFSLRGMQQSFLDGNANHKRRHLNNAIHSGTWKISLLKDVRQFIDEHKEEVAEFLHSDTALSA